MSKTVVGLFSTPAQARQAKQALVSQGVQEQSIHMVGSGADSAAGGSVTGSGPASGQAPGATSVSDKISSYFHNLTGGDETAHRQYMSGVQGGGSVVSVTAPNERASEIAMLLKQQGARELEGATGQTASMGTGSASTGETVIPVIEEQLVVGKREVEHGGIRVYSHVVEHPVDAEVVLHDERVIVERQPVNRAATEADFQAGSGEVVELKAMGEEAVVGKSSRVVEEVRLGKQSTEHAEQIHETVRKTEVDVENVSAGTAPGGNLAGGTKKTGY